VGLPAESEYGNRIIQLEFPDKIAFALSKMKMMVFSTVLILLFTISVLLFANWMLIRQKKLLQSSIDFFNNMAHEFRTPLSNIQLATNLLIRKFEHLKDHSLVTVIKRESVNLLHQVESVLQIARLENGDYASKKEIIKLSDLLGSVRQEMSIRIDEQNAKVELDRIPEDLEIFGDRQHLKNAFRNLLDNALKYCKDQPRISISAKKQPHGVLISVKDNGIGIPPAESKLIFEKFKRVNQGNLHDYKGFGLGLAYVKNIVEVHKGFVRASSEGRNGSSFDIYLPVIPVNGRS
jgi:signal transduction histidine kinase